MEMKTIDYLLVNQSSNSTSLTSNSSSSAKYFLIGLICIVLLILLVLGSTKMFEKGANGYRQQFFRNRNQSKPISMGRTTPPLPDYFEIAEMEVSPPTYTEATGRRQFM